MKLSALLISLAGASMVNAVRLNAPASESVVVLESRQLPPAPITLTAAQKTRFVAFNGSVKKISGRASAPPDRK